MSLQERLQGKPVKLTKLELFDVFLTNLPAGEKEAANIMLRDKQMYPANYVVESFAEIGFTLTDKNVWDWRKANVSR